MPKPLHILNEFINNPQNLDCLDLSNCQFFSEDVFDSTTNADLVEINAAKLAEMTAAFLSASPKELSIFSDHFGVAEYIEVMRAINVPNCRVRTLKLSMNSPMQGSEITKEMMEVIIAGLKSAKQLKELSLKNHFIGHDAARVLAGALPDTSLVKLDLTDCGIRGRGLNAILDQLPNTKLTRLKMVGTHYHHGFSNALVKSMDSTSGKAILHAAAYSPCLFQLTLPKDEYVFNANRTLQGISNWGDTHKDSVELANDINQAQKILQSRRNAAENLAYNLFVKQAPLTEEVVEFLKNGGDEVVRNADKLVLKSMGARNSEEQADRNIQNLYARMPG